MTAQPKIQLRGVKKAFGSKVVLGGVDLDIGVGESVVIIGGSGSGKSVTLKCVLGLLQPDEGSILIDGKDVINMSSDDREQLNRQVGMLFQGAALFDSLPVWENVAFGLLAEKRVNRKQARDIAIEKMAVVGLKSDLADHSTADLSGGMQKRVGLARAIATEPEIIFFDEPTTGLDPIMADIINNVIVHVNQQVGATAMTITHDMHSAQKIGDRIAMLYQGKIIWTGPADEAETSGNPYMDQFINGRTDGPMKIAARA